jgi:hypothetical protein
MAIFACMKVANYQECHAENGAKFISETENKYLMIQPKICLVLVQLSSTLHVCYCTFFTLLHFCTLLYTFVHFCTLLYVLYTFVHFHTFVHFCTLVDTFVDFCILLYTFVHFCTLLYTFVHFCTLDFLFMSDIFSKF